MTIGEYFKCPLCGKDFTIKMQMDNTYTLYDWPIHVSCPGCGNEMDLFFNANGLQPKELKSEEAEKSITFGYSALLPLTKQLYFKELTRVGRMAASTPFLNFSAFFGRFDVSGPLGHWVSMLMGTLIPYRHYLQQLLPIISHKPCNVKAYSTRLASLCKAHSHDDLKDENECLDSFVVLHKATYMNLAIKPYQATGMKHAIDMLLDFVEKADLRQIEAMMGRVNAVMDTEYWLWKEVFPVVADIVNEIQVLFPSMSFATQGNFNMPSGQELYTMTVGYKKLDGWYARCFEALVHGLPFLVALNNAARSGNADVFMVNGQQDTRNLDDFASLNSAGRIGAIRQDAALNDIFVPVLNNHIRNAIQHQGDQFQTTTQLVEYHYDLNDNTKHDDIRLIDVGFMVFMQLLHLLECVMLFTDCEKRLREL